MNAIYLKQLEIDKDKYSIVQAKHCLKEGTYLFESEETLRTYSRKKDLNLVPLKHPKELLHKNKNES